MVSIAVYHHANGVTYDFNGCTWTLERPGTQVHHKDNKVGLTADPNRSFRRFTIVADSVTAIIVNELTVTRLMPAAAPTYKAQDYPKLVVTLDGTPTTWTVKGVILSVTGVPVGNGRWKVTAIFEESSHS